mmetsp:Transcript_89204/g.123908  ORF Transcript_89204/g.123908 Transcript_89204/m.123908 type:complete len:106 (-) Transcript_89204:26-343(-)
MRHISAYLMCVLGGNAAPTADDIKKVLSAAGIEGDDARIAELLKELEGKNVHELMAAGKEKLASFGGGGGGGGAAPAAAAEEVKEEVVEEVEESSSEEMELDLFG